MFQNIETDHKDPNKFWKTIMRLLGGGDPVASYILDEQGNILYEEKEQERQFRRYWSHIYKINDEENRNFCGETERMVEDYLRENRINYSFYEAIHFSRLDRPNMIKPITRHEAIATIKPFEKKNLPVLVIVTK